MVPRFEVKKAVVGEVAIVGGSVRSKLSHSGREEDERWVAGRRASERRNGNIKSIALLLILNSYKRKIQLI